MEIQMDSDPSHKSPSDQSMNYDDMCFGDSFSHDSLVKFERLHGAFIFDNFLFEKITSNIIMAIFFIKNILFSRRS